MKKKHKPFLDFYKYSLKTGYMPTNGMCYFFSGNLKETVQMFQKWCDMFGYNWYWGYDGEARILLDPNKHFDYAHKFTPLRQTIVLFCAAINNEL